MRSRKLSIVAALAVVAAACGSSAPQAQQQPFGLVSAGSEGTPRLLTYDYQPDSSLTYEIFFDTSMDMRSEFPGMGSNDMSMGMLMGGEMGYAVAPGPQEDSVEVTMTAEFDRFDVSHFTMDGVDMSNTVTSADMAELQGAGAIPTITAVVDSSGEVLELRYGDALVPTDFLGSSSFSDPTGMSMMGMLGPEMPAEEVRVGAEWTTDSSQEVPGFGTVASRTHYWITGEETYNGRDVLVIVSSTDIESLTIDFMEMMEAMMQMDDGSLDAMGMSAEELAEMQRQLFAEIDMSMSISYDELIGTTYFDPVDGLAVWSAVNGDMSGSIEMSAPEGTGTMSFDMTMDIQLGLVEDSSGV